MKKFICRSQFTAPARYLEFLLTCLLFVILSSTNAYCDILDDFIRGSSNPKYKNAVIVQNFYEGNGYSSTGQGSIDQAKRLALKECKNAGGTNCKVIAINGNIVTKPKKDFRTRSKIEIYDGKTKSMTMVTGFTITENVYSDVSSYKLISSGCEVVLLFG